MILYPVVQKKVQAEIDRVVGEGRFPNSSDRQKYKYPQLKGVVEPIVI